MPKNPTEFELSLKGFSVEEREAIAVEVIDRIKERTRSGVDKNGRAFKPYSKEYIASKDFKIAGKSAGKINLTLSGDMLDSLEIIANRGSKVKIGYSDGNSEQGKAEGNILGTYGQSSPVGPKRDFLGITKRELDQILAKYKKDDARAAKVLRDVEDAELLSGRVDLEDLNLDE